MSTKAPAAKFVNAGIAVASQVAFVAVCAVGVTLKPVNASPGPSRSSAVTLGAAPKPAFSTRTVHVTVSPTPPSCRIGVFVTTRSGRFTDRNRDPVPVPGDPGGCSKPARANNCPEMAPQSISTAYAIVIAPPFANPVGRLPAPGSGVAWFTQSLRVFVSLFAGLRAIDRPAATVGTAGLKAAVEAPYDTASTVALAAFRSSTPSPKLFSPEPILPSAISSNCPA